MVTRSYTVSFGLKELSVVKKILETVANREDALSFVEGINITDKQVRKTCVGAAIRFQRAIRGREQ